MRAQITRVYGWLALLWAALVIVQVFLAGLGIFGAESFDAHKAFGNILHALTALILLLAIAGPRTGRDIGMSAALFILVTIQIGLVARGTTRRASPRCTPCSRCSRWASRCTSG